MRQSTGRILTTHTGRLARPLDLCKRRDAIDEARGTPSRRDRSHRGTLGVELNFGVGFIEHFRATLSSGSATVRLPQGGALRAASTMTLVTAGLAVAVEARVEPPARRARR